MADNIAVTPGTGASVAADDVGGALHQRVKLSLGADGSAADALGGAGAVAAGVQRMTLASDDPAVAALATIDGHVDGIEGALATLNATDFATEAKQDTLISAVGDLPTNSDPPMAALTRMGDGDYETVAASQTAQALGATGAAGDYLLGLLIVPATTSPGAVQIKDGSNGAITVFTGGADSVSNLVPFLVPLGIRSAVGAWQVTTGANVSAIASGSFT
jgi:hypothetical protein